MVRSSACLTNRNTARSNTTQEVVASPFVYVQIAPLVLLSFDVAVMAKKANAAYFRVREAVTAHPFAAFLALFGC